MTTALLWQGIGRAGVRTGGWQGGREKICSSRRTRAVRGRFYRDGRRYSGEAWCGGMAVEVGTRSPGVGKQGLVGGKRESLGLDVWLELAITAGLNGGSSSCAR